MHQIATFQHIISKKNVDLDPDKITPKVVPRPNSQGLQFPKTSKKLIHNFPSDLANRKTAD